MVWLLAWWLVCSDSSATQRQIWSPNGDELSRACPCVPLVQYAVVLGSAARSWLVLLVHTFFLEQHNQFISGSCSHTQPQHFGFQFYIREMCASFYTSCIHISPFVFHTYHGADTATGNGFEACTHVVIEQCARSARWG
jgi:hypothetical protein